MKEHSTMGLPELGRLMKDFYGKIAGKEGQIWLMAFKRFLRKENPWTIECQDKLLIDRSKPFDPVSFIGKGWSIVEQDENSLRLNEIDLANIQLDPCLLEGEDYINGEKKLTRLKEKDVIRLDAKVLETLWNNKKRIPKGLKKKINGNTQYIFFDGTILQGPSSGRYVLCLYWYDGRWDWDYYWLDDDFDVRDPSAVLAS